MGFIVGRMVVMALLIAGCSSGGFPIEVIAEIPREPGVTVETEFDAPGLEATASEVALSFSDNVDVAAEIEATYGTIYLIDGAPASDPACSQEGGGWVCRWHWPVLEAQSEGVWVLKITRRDSGEPIDVRMVIRAA